MQNRILTDPEMAGLLIVWQAALCALAAALVYILMRRKNAECMDAADTAAQHAEVRAFERGAYEQRQLIRAEMKAQERARHGKRGRYVSTKGEA